jgi:hypothetical protein
VDTELNTLVYMHCNFTQCALKLSDLAPKDLVIADAEKFLSILAI